MTIHWSILLDADITLTQVQGYNVYSDINVLAFKWASIEDFAKAHGYDKKWIGSLRRKFMIPGRPAGHDWVASDEQITEFLNLLQKWGSRGCKKGGKKQRVMGLTKDIEQAREGNYGCATTWCPLGG